MKIGIIGQGFVGSAIREGLKDFYEVLTYDIDESKCNSTHEDVCHKSNIIFVCVPTPMRKSGKCDTRLLESVVEKIDDACSSLDKNPTLVIKSTVPPGTTDRISKTITQNANVCFSPEFLTEANSVEDFKNQSRIIIGGDGAKKVKQMYRKPFPNIPIVVTKSETAEMVKYFINCFLATKVTFANQMYDICESSNIDYDKVCEYALFDKRIGNSHLAVPGPDGDRGFGGHCFPKDLSAMIYYAKQNDVPPEFLIQTGVSNDFYRNNKDWLEMKGRAVSED
jgi:UDPglucose 6-dehydrogenase